MNVALPTRHRKSRGKLGAFAPLLGTWIAETASSFTSDGKRSQGALADVTDVHPEAIGFGADMPAGRARMVYWPAEDGGFRWAVESGTKKGGNRARPFYTTRSLPTSRRISPTCPT